MKQRILETLGFFILILCFAQVAQAQVTIGSGIKPNQGAILDIKQYDDDDSKNGGRTAKKGLGLPRVALVAVDQLEPCTVTNTTNKASHTSLTVYNITDNSATIATLKEGVYTWDGETWQPMGLKGAQGFGPWYQVENPTLPSRMVDTDSYLEGKANLGGAFKTPDGAALSVQTQNDDNPTQGGVNSTKGFMMPRVQLTTANSLDPLVMGGGTVSEKASHKGLTVYHVGGNGIDAGQRIWDGGNWLQVITDIPPTPVTPVSNFTLKNNFLVPLAEDCAMYNPNLSSWHKTELEIKIPTKGNYAAFFRGSIIVSADATNTCQAFVPSSTYPVFWAFGTEDVNGSNRQIIDRFETYSLTPINNTGESGAMPLVFFSLPNLEPDQTYYLYVFAPNRVGSRARLQRHKTYAERAFDITIWPL